MRGVANVQWGCCAHYMPPGAKNVTQKPVFGPSEMFVKFQLSGSNSFLDMRGPKYTAGGPVPLTRPLAEKITFKKCT